MLLHKVRLALLVLCIFLNVCVSNYVGVGYVALPTPLSCSVSSFRSFYVVLNLPLPSSLIVHIVEMIVEAQYLMI